MATTDGWVSIRTTLPRLPSSAARTPVTTQRLLIRPICAAHLDGLHELRTQPEVMRWTAAGRIDKDKGETAEKLAPFLPPRDATAFNCAICLKETGEVIGMGGVHRMNRHDGRDGVDHVGAYGWPELGYMFKSEYWGKGMATEFVGAFLGMWEALERDAVETRVNAKTVVPAGGGAGAVGCEPMPAREELIAMVDVTNVASQRILLKCGFEQFDAFRERHREDPDASLELVAFRCFPRGLLAVSP